MFRRLTITALLAATILTVFATPAFAHDDDDDRQAHDESGHTERRSCYYSCPKPTATAPAPTTTTTSPVVFVAPEPATVGQPLEIGTAVQVTRPAPVIGSALRIERHQEELPETGSHTWQLVGVATVLLLAGGLMMRAARR